MRALEKIFVFVVDVQHDVGAAFGLFCTLAILRVSRRTPNAVRRIVYDL